MTFSRSGGSRPGSARSRRDVQDIVKRRNKPYKTEQQRVIARKRKLDLQTSTASAPAGFTFLPVGTPELSDRCKELSRQKSYAVYIVNAKPVNRKAVDPERISHHVHRIGYHFRAEVIDEAVQELGYIVNRGNFVKESELAEQKKKSLMEQTLAKYNVRIEAPRETPEEVRAAIKELFPRIPEDDLNNIVDHAWAQGSSRVGNADLSLARRVQLATSARIRHVYTDYDRLLRAFEWKDARSIVEPQCLVKLIEWRGENEQEDDGELEEIVRETIIIDDDDDDDDADDDEDSDDSIEITHQVVAGNDFGAETVDERSRAFMRRYQPLPRNNEMRNDLARQKIDAARQRIRNGIAPPQHHLLQAQAGMAQRAIIMTPNYAVGHNAAPQQDEIVIDGRRYKRVPIPPGQQSGGPTWSSPGGQYQHLQPPYQPHRPQALPQPPGPDAFQVLDRPVASIERDENKPSALGSRHVSPGHDRAGKRYVHDQGFGPQSQHARHVERVHVLPDGRIVNPAAATRDFVDLTTSSPRRPAYAHSPYQASTRVQPIDLTSPPRQRFHDSRIRERSPPSEPIPYDPAQPLIDFDARIRTATAHRHNHTAPSHPQALEQYQTHPLTEHHYQPMTQQAPQQYVQHQAQYQAASNHVVPAPLQQAPPPIYQPGQPYVQYTSYYGSGAPPLQQAAPSNSGASTTKHYY